MKRLAFTVCLILSLLACPMFAAEVCVTESITVSIAWVYLESDIMISAAATDPLNCLGVIGGGGSVVNCMLFRCDVTSGTIICKEPPVSHCADLEVESCHDTVTGDRKLPVIREISLNHIGHCT